MVSLLFLLCSRFDLPPGFIFSPFFFLPLIGFHKKHPKQPASLSFFIHLPVKDYLRELYAVLCPREEA